MKKVMIVISGIIFCNFANAQVEKSQPQKTIDSVKAIQKQEQQVGTTSTQVITSDALPLRQQNNNVNELNRIDNNGNINGNSIDNQVIIKSETINTDSSRNSSIYNSNRGTNSNQNNTTVDETYQSQSTSATSVNSKPTDTVKKIYRTKKYNNRSENSKTKTNSVKRKTSVENK